MSFKLAIRFGAAERYGDGRRLNALSIISTSTERSVKGGSCGDAAGLAVSAAGWSSEDVELRLSGEARCVGDVAAIGVGDRDSHQTHPSAI